MFGGCKFTAKEEKVVIELQAQVGNRWVKFATYLTGRTDNYVRNFRSSRQKRLQKLLHTPQRLNAQESKQNKPLVQRVPKFSTLENSPSYQSNYLCLDSEECRMVPLHDHTEAKPAKPEDGNFHG
ncbi:Octamer-binding transcription factor [Parasponia andersonii]|uniref:Octamer-binding transcription factor n=1 Tax=Parasponia andersonii TaxID=3476 RepID=A0A2P5BQH4_PARAD|nr:Octamer-binding transcription factor [Parasponia andersonii]